MVDLDPDHLLGLRALIRQAPPARTVTALPGGFVTRTRGQGLETADLRVFVDGDDPRHIDRNATARSGRIQVRTFQAERDRTTLLLADFRPSMLWGTRRTLRSIAAAEALAMAGWRAIRDGGRVGLLAVTATDPVYLTPRARDRAMVAICGAMARAHATALPQAAAQDTPLSSALDTAGRLAPRGAEIVLATGLDSLGDAFAEAHQALTHRCDLTILRVVDAFEAAPPPQSFRFATASGRTGLAPPSQMSAQHAVQPAISITRTIRADVPPDQQASHG